MLDVSPLRKALASLDKGITRAQANPGDEELRDAVIQRFEYSYELCWKMLKRRLEMDHAVSAQIDQMSFNALMREGGERGYIEEVAPWLLYREQRNITAHTYDQKKATRVYQTALAFRDDAQRLLAALENKND